MGSIVWQLKHFWVERHTHTSHAIVNHGSTRHDKWLVSHSRKLSMHSNKPITSCGRKGYLMHGSGIHGPWKQSWTSGSRMTVPPPMYDAPAKRSRVLISVHLAVGTCQFWQGDCSCYQDSPSLTPSLLHFTEMQLPLLLFQRIMRDANSLLVAE